MYNQYINVAIVVVVVAFLFASIARPNNFLMDLCGMVFVLMCAFWKKEMWVMLVGSVFLIKPSIKLGVFRMLGKFFEYLSAQTEIKPVKDTKPVIVSSKPETGNFVSVEEFKKIQVMLDGLLAQQMAAQECKSASQECKPAAPQYRRSSIVNEIEEECEVRRRRPVVMAPARAPTRTMPPPPVMAPMAPMAMPQAMGPGMTATSLMPQAMPPPQYREQLYKRDCFGNYVPV